MAQRKVVRKRRRIRWKAVIVACVACVLVVYLFASLVGMLMNGFSGGKDTFTACKLSTKKLQQKLSNKDYEGYIEVADYTIYGEHLNLYSSDYQVGGYNAFIGKTMILKNVCTDKEYTINKIDSTLDGQIHGLDLDVGLYEVYIVDNLLEKRLYMSDALDQTVSFYTSTKKSTNYKVELLADKSLLNRENDESDALDRNYVFINVTKETMPETDYDILLNPGPISINANNNMEVNGVSQQVEMYRLAKKVQELLEKEGFKVGISRDEYVWLSTYGEDGTLAKGYASHAKYIINMDVYGGSEKEAGLHVVHSSYVSNALASSIYNQIVNATSMEGRSQDFDVSSSKLYAEGYDMDIDIRESGN